MVARSRSGWSRFDKLYEENKIQWAYEDCRSVQYAYRLQYNIPRGPIEEFENLTEYELEYELILRQEHAQFLRELDEPDHIDISKGSFAKGMRTDPAIYADLKRRIEAGEAIDITLPDDSNVPRYSHRHVPQKVSPTSSDVEIVKPEDVFGRMFGGG